jgi:hypothetical protein
MHQNKWSSIIKIPLRLGVFARDTVTQTLVIIRVIRGEFILTKRITSL